MPTRVADEVAVAAGAVDGHHADVADISAG
jgi:hypothetical protein